MCTVNSCMIGGAVYSKIYITKDKLITYSFNRFYKVLNKVEVKLKDVEGAGLYEDEMYYIEYKDKITYLGYTLEKTKNDLEKIMDILKANGVLNESEKKKRKEKNITIILILILIFIMIFVSIELYKRPYIL